jgi:APA family basic amino acid/polyamine antiporter
MTDVSAVSSASQAAAFRQKLGLFDATMLVAGSMIGSGIFIVPADIARNVGTGGWLLAIWLLTGAMTLMGALCYAELAALMPQAGGQYIFLREAYSPLWGFLYGWTCFLVIQTGSIAAVAVAFAKFLGVLLPSLGTDTLLWQVGGFHVRLALPLPWLAEPLVVLERTEFTVSAGQLVAVAVVLFLTLLNCRGIEAGKWVQNIFTVAKLLGLGLLILLGLTVAADPQTLADNFRDLWQGIAQTEPYRQVSQLLGQEGWLAALMVAGGAMVGALFAADAWNNITFTAGEVRDPRRTLPASLVLGAGLVIGLYLLTNLAYLAALPVRGDARLAEELKTAWEQAKTPAARAAVEQQYRQAVYQLGIDHARDDRVGTAVLERVSPELGVPVMALAIMISTFGCVNGMILMGARLYYAMARDGLFFQAVGRLNAQGVPAAGLLLQGLWSILLIFSGTYTQLLDYVIFAALLFYVLTVAGLFVLRWRWPQAERPYRVVGYPLVPALYLLLCSAILLDLLVVRPLFTWPGLILVAAGVPVYGLWRWRQPKAAQRVANL